MQIDLHLQFQEVTNQDELIANAPVVPMVGSYICSQHHGLRLITKIVYEFTPQELKVFLRTVVA
jgi:hypothetical protein